MEVMSCRVNIVKVVTANVLGALRTTVNAMRYSYVIY